MTDITREQFFEFIKSENDKNDAISKPTQHYLDYFDKYQNTEKKGDWNWSALWGAFWFMHRQIDWFWFPLFIIDCALCTQILSPYGIAIFIALRFLFARYANYFYLTDIFRKISKGQISNNKRNEIFAGYGVLAPEFLLLEWFVYLYKSTKDKKIKFSEILIIISIIGFIILGILLQSYPRYH